MTNEAGSWSGTREGRPERVFDITKPIEADTAVLPGDPDVAITRTASVARGDAVNLTKLTMGTHVGTHVDAPRHISDTGKPVDSLPLGSLVGPCRLVDLGDARTITAQDLEGLALPANVERLVLKSQVASTGFAASLTADAARWIVDRGVRLVGVQGYSVEVMQPDGSLPVHQVLLGAEVVIIEGLDLSGVEPGDYRLICLPLLVRDADGAPARVILETLVSGD